MLSSADLRVGDLDFGEVLPVPTVAAIPGAARKPENPDLLVLAVPHDLGGDPGALHVRRPALDLLAVARDEHVSVRYLVPWLGIQQPGFDRDSPLRPAPATTRGSNRVTHRARYLNA